MSDPFINSLFSDLPGLVLTGVSTAGGNAGMTISQLTRSDAGIVAANIIGIMLQAKAEVSAIAFAARQGEYELQAMRQITTGASSPSPEILPGIPVSVRTAEIYDWEAEVTQYMVEDGSVISDHIILRPFRLELGFEVDNFYGTGAAKLALDKLVDKFKQRNILEIITTFGTLQNMVCKSIHAENITPNWGALEFRASFQQLSLAKLSTSAYRPESQDRHQPEAGRYQPPILLNHTATRVLPQ